MKNLLSLLAVVLLALCQAHATQYDFPAARTITWAGNVGISGGIPTGQTVFAHDVLFYGADPTGAADSRTAIQNAINACTAGQVLWFPASGVPVTYRLNTALNFAKGIVLRGETDSNGLPLVTLKGYNTGGGRSILTVGNSSSLVSTDIVTGYTKGSTSITVSSATSFVVGRLMLLDQLNAGFVSNVGGEGTASWVSRASGTRAMCQLVEITSVSGTTIGFTPALYWTYDAANTPQASVLTTATTKNVGLENFILEDTVSTSTGGQDRDILAFNNCENWWMKNVQTVNCFTSHVYLNRVLFGEIRKSYMHGAWTYTQNHAYGFRGGLSCSGLLVEDNIFGPLRGDCILEYGSSGNVVGYNYFVPGINDAAVNAMPPNAQPSHGAHPMMNLFEGNIGSKFQADYTWGTSSHNSIWRNYFTGIGGSFTQLQTAIDLGRSQTYYNIAGNIIGGASMTAGYVQWPAVYNYTGSRNAFRFGYKGDSESTTGGATDAWDNVILKGNYNTYDAGIPAGESLGGQTLATSLYLPSAGGSAPSTITWGGLAWPMFNASAPPADFSTINNAAKYRYEHALADPPDDLTPVDILPPTPNPSTISGGGTHNLGIAAIQVTATTSTDARSNPVQYNCSVDGAWLGWQDSPVFLIGGLNAGTGYTVSVKARDSAAALNESTASTTQVVTTDAGTTTTHTSPINRATGY